jgi:hypothetical protein
MVVGVGGVTTTSAGMLSLQPITAGNNKAQTKE